MENIFKDAHLGKAYKTRAGHKAVFYNHHAAYASERAKYVTMILENREGIYRWYYDGTAFEGQEYLDIISEWQEEVNDEEIKKLAEDYISEHFEEYEPLVTWGEKIAVYKAGYKKALEKRRRDESKNCV